MLCVPNLNVIYKYIIYFIYTYMGILYFYNTYKLFISTSSYTKPANPVDPLSNLFIKNRSPDNSYF